MAMSRHQRSLLDQQRKEEAPRRQTKLELLQQRQQLQKEHLEQ